MSANVLGRINWETKRDREGYRSYDLELLVETTDYNDGPLSVALATGAPLVGAPWTYGNDIDLWSYCTPEYSIKPVYTKEKCKYWIAGYNFNNKNDTRRCQDISIEDPLSEPPNISGSFSRYQKPAEKDRNDKAIKSSSHEVIRGLTREANRPSVVIEQNVLSLGLDVFSQMINTVNDSAMWGLDPRTIMLVNVSWQRKLYGVCSFYYTRRFEFEIDYDTWDMKKGTPNALIDVGYKVLRGQWVRDDGPPVSYSYELVGAPDKNNPKDFVMYFDVNGNVTGTRVLLDGNGEPLEDPNTPVELDDVEIYDESNFFSLGIPSSL